ncbi:Hypothetical predicted protein, partial [Paramuricea clavata]
MKDNVDNNEDPTSTSSSSSIAEVEDDSFFDNAEKDLNSSICPESNHGVTGDKDENFTPLKLSSSTSEAKLDKNKDLVFDTTRKFPTDRGHFKENITDCDLKIMVMHHESCRPTGPFEYEDEEGNSIVNFSARYYNKYIDNMSIQRLWLCYSMELQKPYCEVCWLFADRASPNYENHRGWINGVSDSTSDITRIDQLSVIIRRVQIYGDKCSIEENFLGFVKLDDATANGIVSTTKAFLQSLGINFSKIRGQGWRELGLEAEKGSLTLKKLCTTRWSSRIDAVRAVRDRYPHIMRVLTRLSLTSTNKAEREDAKQLKNKIEKLEFVIFIVMWERVLRAINSASKELQSQKIDLSVASRLLNSALSELVILRSSWNSVLLTATALAQ